MNDDKSIFSQLQILKAMTVRTGIIHEAQAIQLKTWPMLIDNVIQSEARVFPETKTVKFICTSSGLRPTKKMKETCENIGKWTKTLLWDDTRVVVEINKKKVYDSSRT